MNVRTLALVTTAITGVGWSVSATAQDQTADAAAQTQTEAPRSTADRVTQRLEKRDDADTGGDIVVVGTRNAIANSIDSKRSASAQKDVVTAEDVARFPDVNVAESLSRLPGVTIDRTAGGEGAKVSINGIDSRLILTQFNGQPIATAEPGANNHDTGRSFNFRNLAPELIGTVEVYKTSEARLDEGGVGGSIIVNSRLPFDLPRNTVSVAANYNINLRNKERDPRASLLYSWFNEDKTFGILASVAYNRSVLGSGSFETRYGPVCNGNGWGGCTNGATGSFRNPALLPTVTSGPALNSSMLVPQFLWMNATRSNSIRTTGYVAVQARPVDNFEVQGTALRIWGDFSDYTQTFQTDFSVPWNQRNAYDSAAAPITRLSTVTTQAAGVTGGAGNFAVRMDEYYKRSKLNTEVYNIRTRWSPGRLDMIVNAGITQASGGSDPEYYLSFYGNTSGSFGFDRNGPSLTLAKPPTDPTLFKTRTAGQQAGFVKYAQTLDRYQYAKFDGKLNLDWGPVKDVLFGGRIQQHISVNKPSFYNTVFPRTETMAAYQTSVLDPALWRGLGAGGALRSIVGLTQDSLKKFSEANKSPGNASGNYRDAGNFWNTVENTNAAYGQVDYSLGRLSGDIGVRYAKTINEQTYRSTLDYDPWFEEQVTIRRGYDDWLPSFNAAYELTDDIKLRAAASKVVSRPTFADMSGQVEYSIDRYSSFGPFFGGNGGNPDLKPYRAWRYNAAFEWYFAKGSLFNIDLFINDVQSYIVRKNTFVQVVVPTEAVQFCQQNVSLFCHDKLQRINTMLINTPFNGSNAQVRGASVGFTGNLIWGFGIQANATVLDQKYGSYSDKFNAAGKLPLPYLSKFSYTVSPFFERGPVQARVSYTWRSKYLDTVGTETDAPTYVNAWGQLDAQAAYNVTDRLAVTIAAQNLLDSTERPTTNGNLPLAWNRYGTRLTAGVTFRMF